MKKITKSIALIAALAAMMVSCAKEIEQVTKETPQSRDMVNITVNAGSASTKTFINGTAVKWADSGEYLEIFQDKDGAVTHKTSGEGKTTDSGATMSFDVAFDATTGTAFNYYAFYPAASYNNNTGLDVKINTPANQTPTATSFDPAADLLIAQKVENGNTQATTLNMAFTRAVAVGKMTLTNLASSDDVKKVTFSAKDGSTPIKVAGRTEFSLATAKPKSSYANNVSETSIILDYSALNLQANSSMDVFFTCYPFEISAGDSFTVEVQTATQSFTRTVDLTGAQEIIFAPGSASRFSVNMSEAVVENIAVDLPYACLTAAEYNAAGGSGSYGNVTVSKSHGDKWETYAMYTSSSIQIRNSDNPGSFVKLPVFTENIKTVNVTLSSAIAADKKLTLETTADGTEGSVLALNTVAEQTSYSFDLTSKTVKTAYLRSVGAAAKVLKIEVLAGTDTRAAKVAATSTVSAAVNGSDPVALDVSWTAVDGAAGYEVTLTPTSGPAVVRNAAANATSITISGLTPSTSYTPSVVTIADPYLAIANSDSQAGSAVATGAPAISSISEIKAQTSGSAVAFSATLTNALVTVVSGNQFYMEDASGAVWVNTSGHGMSAGDKISGAISGTIKKQNNNYQIVSFVSSSATKTTGNTVNPTTVTSSTLASSFADYESKYVKVSNVTISAVDGSDLSVSGTDGWIVYNSSGFNITKDSEINVVGIACYFNSTKQVKIFSLAEDDKISIASEITATDKSVAVDGTVSIGATTNSSATITYSSDDNTVATVNASGVVTGKKAGSAHITCSVESSGKYTAAAKVITVTVTSGSLPTYSLYSGDPAEGDYVIVYSGRAMNTTVTSSRLQYSEPTITSETITNPDASIIWHISASGDYWVLYNADANKYAAGTSTKNQGAMINSVTDYAKWTWTKITGSTVTYEFENKGRAALSSDNDKKWLRNNGTYGFACYANGTGGSLKLYKRN